jgi:hypothetical protein
MLGPIILVVAIGAVGSFIAAAECNTRSVWDVLVYVLRGALFSLVLAFLCSDWIEARFGLGGHTALAAVAAVIGYNAHRARDLVAFARLLARVKGADHDGR